MTLTRDDALALDEADDLAPFLDEFEPLPVEPVGTPDATARRPLVYLDGNSLGRPPKRTAVRLAEVLGAEWASSLIRSWDAADPAPGRGRWLDLPRRVGDVLAPLIGARAGEVVVHDSTTVNLYQLVHAALALRPERRVIAVDPGDFPTDRYVVDGIAAATGCTVRHGFDRLDDVAVAVRSLVDYRTAEIADLDVETARAHAAGALVVWDLSHAAGAIEVDLHGAGVQIAVGCTYKFLNGGPGAPAFSYVAADLQPSVRSPIQGWFAQRDQFLMGPEFTPRDDIGRLLLGTPTVLSLAAAEVGIALTAEAGIAHIAAKGRRLTGFGLELCDQWRLATRTPRDPERRGGHVAVVHPDARELTARLATELGVIADHRAPDVIRLGMSPLTTRFTDVWAGIDAIRELLDARSDRRERA